MGRHITGEAPRVRGGDWISLDMDSVGMAPSDDAETIAMVTEGIDMLRRREEMRQRENAAGRTDVSNDALVRLVLQENWNHRQGQPQAPDTV